MDYVASCTQCVRLETSNWKVAYTKPIQVNDIFRPKGIDFAFAEYVHPKNPYVLGLLLVMIDSFSRNGQLNRDIVSPRHDFIMNAGKYSRIERKVLQERRMVTCPSDDNEQHGIIVQLNKFFIDQKVEFGLQNEYSVDVTFIQNPEILIDVLVRSENLNRVQIEAYFIDLLTQGSKLQISMTDFLNDQWLLLGKEVRVPTLTVIKLPQLASQTTSCCQNINNDSAEINVVEHTPSWGRGPCTDLNQMPPVEYVKCAMLSEAYCLVV